MSDNLERKNVPVDVLIPNENNPNKMKPREFDLLVDNIQTVGFTDPILVRPVGENSYRIVGGHHRWEAAKYLGYTEVPVTVILDEDFDQEAEEVQLLRHNVIHGSLDPEMFVAMYERYALKYGDDLIQDMFGFAEEAEFKKLIAQTANSLPPEMQKKFKEAAAEIKTIDGLAKLLNRMFTMYGDTLPYGYMIVDYGQEQSLWLRVSKKTFDAAMIIGESCIERKRTVDDMIGHILQLIAKGELQDVVDRAVEGTPEVDIPEGIQTVPTKDNIDAVKSLGA